MRIAPVERLRTLRDWEQRRYEPDQADKLRAIAADAAFVARAVAAA